MCDLRGTDNPVEREKQLHSHAIATDSILTNQITGDYRLPITETTEL
jgi:hypothetical protein